MNGNMKLRGQSLGLLSMLGVQFILGMILNLFVQLPAAHPGTSGGYISRSLHSFGWAITNGGGIALLLHVLIAIGLLLLSLSLVVRAAASKQRSWLTVSIIGAIGVLAALTNGLAFLGYNHDANSFVMAMGFLVAATAYSFALTLEVSPATASAPESAPRKTEEAKSYGKFRHSHG